MSVQQKVIGACDAALLVIVGVLQLGAWLAIVSGVPERSAQSARLAHAAEVSHTTARVGG